MEGSVILRLGKEEVFRQNFARGLFGRMKGGAEGWDERFSVNVPASSSEQTLTVQVTPNKRAADVKKIPLTPKGGSSHRLEVYLSKDARVTAQLN